MLYESKITTADVFAAITRVGLQPHYGKESESIYEIIAPWGIRYSAEYVFEVANELSCGQETDNKNMSPDAIAEILKELGFKVESKQIKYTLTITADDVKSTDKRFAQDDIRHGGDYTLLDVYFVDGKGNSIRYVPKKCERIIPYQVMPRLAFQIFEKNIEELMPNEKNDFPICKRTPDAELVCGIFHDRDSLFHRYRDLIGVKKCKRKEILHRRNLLLILFLDVLNVVQMLFQQVQEVLT